MGTDTDTDTTTTPAAWLSAGYFGYLIVLPVALYFRAQLYTDERTIAPLLVYCVLVAWFRPRGAR